MTALTLIILALLSIPVLWGLWQEYRRQQAMDRRIRKLALDLRARDASRRASLRRRVG